MSKIRIGDTELNLAIVARWYLLKMASPLLLIAQSLNVNEPTPE
jgi:hypothetical protein